MNATITAAIPHEIKADGPASVVAINALKSQPDPITDPVDDQRRPKNPTSLLSETAASS